LGSLGQFGRSRSYLFGTGGDAVRVLADSLHGAAQFVDGLVEIGANLLHRRDERLFELLLQVAIGKLAQALSERDDSAHALADIGGELDHLEYLAIRIEDRVVSGLNPDLFAALAVADKFIGDEFTVAE